MGLFKEILIDDSGMEEINHDKFNSIVNYLDENTNTDEEFCKVFTKKVFKVFGTRYTSKGIVEEYEDRYVDSELNRLRGK